MHCDQDDATLVQYLDGELSRTGQSLFSNTSASAHAVPLRFQSWSV